MKKKQEDTCPVSSTYVNDEPDTKAIECDICKSWSHKDSAIVSDALYAVITDSDDNSQISWFCKACNKGAKQIMSHILTLNKRQDELENKIEEVGENVHNVVKRVDSQRKELVAIKKLTDQSQEIETKMDEQLDKSTDLESKVEGITKEAYISVTEKNSVLENKVDEIAKDTENNVAGNKSVTDLADRLTRANNVIIHRITEDTNKSKAENQKDALDRILQLCQLVTEQTYDTNDITIKRLGKKPEDCADGMYLESGCLYRNSLRVYPMQLGMVCKDSYVI